MPPQITILPDAQAIAEDAARLWMDLAQAAITQHERFTVALAGGSTPKGLYARLAQPPHRDDAIWANTHIFWGDERMVPPDQPGSNYHMAHETLLSHVALSPDHIHPIPTDVEPGRAAALYERTIQAGFGLEAGAFPRFDLVLLGMGNDGHTASLFPGSFVLDEQNALVMSPYVDHLDAHRITLTLPVINAAANVLFLVTGDNKAATLRDVLAGTKSLPAQLVTPAQGRVTWLLDEAAAAHLP